eukprot:c2795_g1_i1 orf=57-314(-)
MWPCHIQTSYTQTPTSCDITIPCMVHASPHHLGPCATLGHLTHTKRYLPKKLKDKSYCGKGLTPVFPHSIQNNRLLQRRDHMWPR